MKPVVSWVVTLLSLEVCYWRLGSHLSRERDTNTVEGWTGKPGVLSSPQSEVLYWKVYGATGDSRLTLLAWPLAAESTRNLPRPRLAPLPSC